MGNNVFCRRDVLNMEDFSKEEILYLLSVTKEMKECPPGPILNGLILGSCFFEPSTRTRLSFESAMLQLGGQVVGFNDGAMTSQTKGESLHDTMKMMEHYTDLIVLRHSKEGAAQWAADIVDIPVINAGDGANQHPTQTLIDLYSIQETQKTLDGLHIALVGDLKYGRTVHSLAQALAHFNPRLYFVSPPSLEAPKALCNYLREREVKFSFHSSVEELLPKIDILYMTRIQEERFLDKREYEELKGSFCIHPKILHTCKATMKILHPLPRVKEIDFAVDATPFAYYFEQAKNGIYARQALLSLLLGKMS